MTKTSFALALALLVPFTASAQDHHVRYTDLDLTTASGVVQLDGRISRAVEATCPPDDSIELARKAVVARCRRMLTASTAAQRDNAIARARSGSPDSPIGQTVASSSNR